MKHRATESIDCFAFRFKNNLHRLAKLGEPVDRNSPQFIMSQFISKTKPDIQKHLVLKAEEYKDLSEIVEAAKRIERSFSPVHSPSKPTPSSPNALVTNPTSVPPRGRERGLRCHHCSTAGHMKSNCPEKMRKNTFTTPNRSKEVCRLWNKHQRSPCTLEDQSCKYGRLHKCNTCSKLLCKEINHENLTQPIANSCQVQKPQVNQPEPSTSALPSTSSNQAHPATPPLFGMPTLRHSSSELSVNLNRTILSCQVTSAGKLLQLPLDSCCSVTLCSLDHAQHIHSSRPELKYKKLEKPVSSANG